MTEGRKKQPGADDFPVTLRSQWTRRYVLVRCRGGLTMQILLPAYCQGRRHQLRAGDN